MYQIYNYRKRRIKTSYIIICHAVDLIKTNIYIDPIVKLGNYKYTWGIWQEYFLRNINKYALPCHYFMELLDKDYVIYNGLPDFKPSYFLEDLVKYGILEHQYSNSILIVIGENFNVDIPEQRLLDHLCDKLLSQLVRQYNLNDFSRIKILDECLALNWQNFLKMSNVDYDLQPMKYFDKINLKMSYNKYCVF